MKQLLSSFLTIFSIFNWYALALNIRKLHLKSFRLSSKTNSIEIETKLIKAQVPLNQLFADILISSVFSIKPLFHTVAKSARNDMIGRAREIGVDWNQRVDIMQQNQEVLNLNYDNIFDKSLVYPEYYLKPFHAYEEGNLSWKAAMEVEVAALAVHAHVYTGNIKNLDRNGDNQLRDQFHVKMKDSFASTTFKPKRIVDIGCSTGLSTLKLHESFPDAEIYGIDLSPFMLSGWL